MEKFTQKLDKSKKFTEKKPEKCTKSRKTYDAVEKLTEKIDKSRKIYRKKS